MGSTPVQETAFCVAQNMLQVRSNFKYRMPYFVYQHAEAAMRFRNGSR
jgi:hypothetical protein